MTQICFLVQIGAPREHLEFEQPTGRIIDGTPMNISEVPWQVSLQFNDGKSHFCGGSIIGDRWILTAAHCLGGARLIRVRIGATHVYSEGKLIDAEETFLHPKFDARVGHRFDFDFGLIKLQKPIEFNDKVRAITLPDYADENDAAGTECLVAGWGRTIEGGSISTTLLGAKTPIVDHKACKKAYGQSNTVTPRMICAGYANGGKNSKSMNAHVIIEFYI